MTSLATDLKVLLLNRIADASQAEMADIVGTLCAAPRPTPLPIVQPCGIESQWEAFDDVWAFDRASGLYMTRHYVAAIKAGWQNCMDVAAKFTPIKSGLTCRAPTIRERLRAVDYTRRNPALNTNIFTGKGSDWEWTSTLLINEDGSPSVCAWGVYCNSGDSLYDSQNGNGFVRAVCVSQ